MDPRTLIHAIRPRATGASRRELLAGLGGVAAALHFAGFGIDGAEDAVARKKSKRRKKKPAVSSPPPGTPPPDSPPDPPPSPPGPDLAYQCAAESNADVCGSA